MKKQTTVQSWRQGDVLVMKVDPDEIKGKSLKPVPLDKGRVVLAYGEVTGHYHGITPAYHGKPVATKTTEPLDLTNGMLDKAIEGFTGQVDEQTDTRVDMRLFLSLKINDEKKVMPKDIQTFQFETETGDRYLVSEKPFDLTHDEHATISFEPGVYKVIRQKEFSVDMVRNVAD